MHIAGCIISCSLSKLHVNCRQIVDWLTYPHFALWLWCMYIWPIKWCLCRSAINLPLNMSLRNAANIDAGNCFQTSPPILGKSPFCLFCLCWLHIIIWRLLLCYLKWNCQLFWDAMIKRWQLWWSHLGDADEVHHKKRPFFSLIVQFVL